MGNDRKESDFTSMDREALEAEAARLAEELESCNRAYANLARTMRREGGTGLELAETILSQSPSVLFRRLAEPSARLVYVSDNISRWGYRAEDLLSGAKSYKDVVHPEDMDGLRREIEEFEEQNLEEYTQEYRILTSGGEVRWVHDHTSVVRDPDGNKLYNQGIVTDITERKLFERKLRRSEEKYRRIVETTGQGFVLMDTDLRISDVNDAQCALLGVAREQLIGKLPFEMASPEFRAYMLANRERFMNQEKRVFESEILRPDGGRVPVLVHGNTLRNAAGKLLGHVAFVTDLTEQKRALKLAGEVQRRLLDVAPPASPGLDVAGRSEPCDEVGGDYLDYPPGAGKDQGLMAVVGDISGHGVDAALCMTAARALFRAHAAAGLPPASILTALNREFTMDHYESGRFMTLFVLKVRKDGSLVWARAGHDPALAYDPGGDVFHELTGNGLPVGVDPDFTYEENTIPGSAPGRIVALGSDGIWEAHDPDGNMYGKERFREVVRENARRPAREIVAAVFESVKAFMSGNRHRDDVTLLVIKQDDAVS